MICDIAVVQGCSDFLAGNSIQSSVRFAALDETAIFGCVCRHEFPLLFFNLRYGERYIIYVCHIEHTLKIAPFSGLHIQHLWPKNSMKTIVLLKNLSNSI